MTKLDYLLSTPASLESGVFADGQGYRNMHKKAEPFLTLPVVLTNIVYSFHLLISIASPAKLGANSKIALGIGTGYGNTSGAQHALPVPLLIEAVLF